MIEEETMIRTEYDVIVIGGSFAGLSAAMPLARARRKVLILDAGMPRNRFAGVSHGFFGQDGRATEEILATGRRQLMAYPTVHFHRGRATDAAQTDRGFMVTFEDSILDQNCEARGK